MSWIRVPPEAAHFSLEKNLSRVLLYCVIVVVSYIMVHVHCVYTYVYITTSFFTHEKHSDKVKTMLINYENVYSCKINGKFVGISFVYEFVYLFID